MKDKETFKKMIHDQFIEIEVMIPDDIRMVVRIC